jgi:hypothetical protein
VDFAKREFGVEIAGATRESVAEALGQYAAGYQRRLGQQIRATVLALPYQDHTEFLHSAAQQLVFFVYEHVELARRRAMDEMLQAAHAGLTDGEALRRRVLDYLQHSAWDERLESVRGSQGAGLEVEVLLPVLDELVSPSDAASLRGAVANLLSSYANVPGLLVLRALAEVLATDGQPEVVRENLSAALAFARQEYAVAAQDLAPALALAIRRASARHGAAEQLLAIALNVSGTDRTFVRELLRHLPPTLAPRALAWLAQQLATICATVVPHKEDMAA